MKRYLVKRTIRFSRVIEADSREEALEIFYEWNADTKLIKETATLIKTTAQGECSTSVLNPNKWGGTNQ